MSSVENYIPYQPNAQGLTEALIDLKSTMPSQTVFKVTGYETTCFENVNQGDALYSRASDGQVGKACLRVKWMVKDSTSATEYLPSWLSIGQTRYGKS